MIGPESASPAGAGSSRTRGVSPAVASAVLLAVTTLLAATVAVTVGLHGAADPAPQIRVSGTLVADDGWPDGQVIELTHEAGEVVEVDEIALVVTLPRTGTRTRLVGFPTRRLTVEHVRGAPIFDAGYAGIDGEIDAAHTDGRWESGETAEVRIARSHHDVRPGETARVRVVHLPSNAVVTRERIVAT